MNAFGKVAVIVVTLCFSCSLWGCGGEPAPTTVVDSPPPSPPRPVRPSPVVAGDSSTRPAGAAPGLPGALLAPPAWISDGAPFDVNAFFQNPAEANNRAPLYLSAYFEFSSALAPCVPASERDRSLTTVRRREEAFGSLLADWQADSTAMTGEQVDAMLAQYAAGFEKIRAAQSRPECVFAPSFEVLAALPHLEGMQLAATVASIRIGRSIDHGRFDSAIEDLELMLRMAQDVRRRGHSQCFFETVTAFQFHVLPAVQGILTAPSISPAQCRKVIDVLAANEPPYVTWLTETMHGQYVHDVTLLHQLFHQTGALDPSREGETLAYIRSAIAPEMADALTGFQQQIDARDFNEDKRAVDRHYQSVLDNLGSRQPLVDIWRAAKNAQPAEEPMLYDTLGWREHASTIGVVMRIAAEHRGAMCLAFLKLWQLENDEPPGDLPSIVQAAGYSDAPLDPFTRQPFRVAQSDGAAVVYSVGFNETDDGGRSTASGGDDLVFSLP